MSWSARLAAANTRIAAWLCLAAGLPFLTLCQGLAAPLTLDVGGPGDQRFLREFLPPIVGERVTYRWSRPQAELRLHGSVAQRARVTVRVDGGAGGSPRRLLLVRPQDGRVLGDAIVSSGWQSCAFDVARGPWRMADLREPWRLGLAAERYRPGPDSSAFGFKLDSVYVEPVAIDWPLALARTLLLLWPFAIVLAYALRIRERLHESGRALLAGVLLLTLPASLGALAHLLISRPLATAWALPPMPVTCSVLSLGLAWRWLRSAADRARPQVLGRVPRVAPALATGVALVGLGLLYFRVTSIWAVALAAVAVAAALFLTRHNGTAEVGEATGAASASSQRALLLTAALVIVLAFGLRFYQVTELPSGMWRDEARHGLAALRIIEDDAYRPMFLPAADVPAAGAYAFVPSFLLFGIRTWTMRLVTALAGALTVIPLAYVARRLTGRWDAAWLAAGLLAGSTWHLTISRLSFMSVFHPLCELTGLALSAHALDLRAQPVRRSLWLAAAGATVGLALHTYHSGRLAPLIAAAFVLGIARDRLRGWRGLAALAPAAAGFALVAAPLWLYAARQPREANARIAEVSLFSRAVRDGDAPLAAFDASLGRHLRMLHVRGDTIGRHNLPGQPELDPFAGLGLLAGLLVLAVRPRDGHTLFLVSAIGLGLLPSLLSVDGPRATRAFDLLPYACIVAAVGWGARARATRRHVWLPAGLTLAAALCAYWTYFLAAPRDEAVWRSFYAVETRVGVYLRAVAEGDARNDPAATYVPAELARREVTQYLTHGLRYGVYDSSGLTPRPAGPFRVVAPADADPALAMRLAEDLGRRLHVTSPGPLLPDGRTPAFTILEFE